MHWLDCIFFGQRRPIDAISCRSGLLLFAFGRHPREELNLGGLR